MPASEVSVTPLASPTRSRTLLRAIASAAWNDNRALIVIALTFLLAGFLAQALTGIPGLMRDVFRESFGLLFLLLALPLPVFFLIGRLQVTDEAGRFLPGVEGWKIAVRRFRERYLNPGSLTRALVAGVSITLILNTFGSWKRTFPRIIPFTWDEPLARLDRAVHFGTDPWRLLQPLLGSPSITLWLDDLYFTWIPVVFTTMALLVWSGRSDLRNRGLLGIAFVWIGLGTVGATALASAGPCYYGYLVPGPNPYAPLLAYLRQTAADVSLFTIAMQDVAWALHQTGKADIYSGISAMPSVHVAMPVLYAMVAGQWNRWVAVSFWIYTALILIATIHLGWHYAIDGYFSIIAVLLYWKLSARLGRRHQPVEAA